MPTYKVRGRRSVFGHEPGEVFEVPKRDGLLITPGGFEHSEAELLESGRLERVEEKKPDDEPKIRLYRQED